MKINHTTIKIERIKNKFCGCIEHRLPQYFCDNGNGRAKLGNIIKRYMPNNLITEL
jgi:hypothetical protein